jgi:Domain of unknown function (DUF4411)
VEYCLDTSVYIQAYRTYYAFDLAPGFWRSLEENAGKGVLVSPSSVYTELVKGDDDLAKWAKEHKEEIFSEPDQKVVEALREIADFSNSRYQDKHWVRDFLAGADPWVIAYAKVHDLTVVAMESSKGSEEINQQSKQIIGKIKIPNMCEHFGVKCISTFEMVRTLKIGLG